MNFSSPKTSGFSVFTRPFGDVFNLPTSEEVQTGGICWGLPLVLGAPVSLPKALLQTGT